MFDRPGLLVAISLLPAIAALVGLGLAPGVETDYDPVMMFALHGWLGMPVIATGARTGAARRVSGRLLAVIPMAAIAAGVAGLALGLGVGSGGDDRSWGLAVALVLVVFVGLAVAEGAAIASLLAATSLEGLAARGLRVTACAAGISFAVLVTMLSMLPVTEPFVPPFADEEVLLAKLLGLAGVSMAWLVGVTLALDRLGSMPEFGGGIRRPPVDFTCPRCGLQQQQQGFAGCRRCGLDVRVEVP